MDVRNFDELRSFIEKNPFGAQNIIQEWRNAQKRYRLPRFKSSREWHVFLEEHQNLRLDPHLFVGSELEEAYGLGDTQRQNESGNIQGSNFSPGSFGTLLSFSLLPFLRRKPELMQHDPKYQKIAGKLKNEWIQKWQEKNPGQKFSPLNSEWLNYVYGHTDGRYFSILHQEAEKMFREGHDIVAEEKDERKKAVKLEERKKTVERYDKNKDRVYKGLADYDPSIKITKETIAYHAMARYEYSRNSKEATDEEKNKSFEQIYQEAEDRAWEEFAYKYPKKAAEYSRERYKILSPKIKLAIERNIQKNQINTKTTQDSTVNVQIPQVQQPPTQTTNQDLTSQVNISQAQRLQTQTGQQQPSVNIQSFQNQPASTTSQSQTIITSHTFKAPTHPTIQVQQKTKTSSAPQQSDSLPQQQMNKTPQPTTPRNTTSYPKKIDTRFFDYIGNRFRVPSTSMGRNEYPGFFGNNFLRSQILPSGIRQSMQRISNMKNKIARPRKQKSLPKSPLPKKIPPIPFFAPIWIYLAIFGLIIGGTFFFIMFFQEGGIGGIGGEGTGDIPGLKIEKSGPANVQNGENITYTINVTYSGNEEIIISDPIPVNTTFVDATPKTYKNESNTISWNLKENPGVSLFTITLRPEQNDIQIKNKVSARLIGATSGGRTGGSGTIGLHQPLPEFVSLMTGQGRNISVLGDEDSFTNKVIANGSRLPLPGKENYIRQIYREALSFNVNPLIVLTTWGTEAFFGFNNLEFGCDPHDTIGGIRGFDLQLKCSAKTWDTHMTTFQNKKSPNGTYAHTDAITHITCIYSDAFIYAAERYGPTCTSYDGNDSYQKSFTEKYKILLGI